MQEYEVAGIVQKPVTIPELSRIISEGILNKTKNTLRE